MKEGKSAYEPSGPPGWSLSRFQPHEVGLKFWKIGITRKFCSNEPFLLGPSFPEPGNRTQNDCLKLLNVSI